MDEHWETLTFGDLRPGDTVKLDEEGPEQVARTVTREWSNDMTWMRTDLTAHWYPDDDPVLVRFPRPEVEA